MKLPPWFRYAANAVCAPIMVWGLHVFNQHNMTWSIPAMVLLATLTWNLTVLSYLVVPRGIKVVKNIVITDDGPKEEK